MLDVKMNSAKKYFNRMKLHWIHFKLNFKKLEYMFHVCVTGLYCITHFKIGRAHV